MMFEVYVEQMYGSKISDTIPIRSKEISSTRGTSPKSENSFLEYAMKPLIGIEKYLSDLGEKKRKAIALNCALDIFREADPSGPITIYIVKPEEKQIVEHPVFLRALYNFLQKSMEYSSGVVFYIPGPDSDIERLVNSYGERNIEIKYRSLMRHSNHGGIVARNENFKELYFGFT